MEQYIFAPTACEAGLEEELAAALEKRTACASLPGMWKKTDALNRYAARGSSFTQVLPWVLILAGLFLTIPCMEPKELRTPLIAGAFFMLLGISSLLRQRPARRKGSFRRAAAGMLQNTSGLAEASVQVVFDDEGMKVITQDSTRTVPYEEMEMLIETPQLYLLTYGGKATLLQKKDLTGDAEAFVGFLSAHALSVYQTEDQ
ncbi:MAG: YcxB family protein [Oscillospiraceae bacterium]